MPTLIPSARFASHKASAWPSFLGKCSATLVLLLATPVLGAENAAIDTAHKEQDAAAHSYLASTQRLLEGRILPSIKSGILKVSTARPYALFIGVTNDPSPYHIAVTTDERGAISISLSLGYLAMQDAALDAVALAGAVGRQRDLRKYLRYQLVLARQNELRTKQGQPRLHAKTFGEYLGLDPKFVMSVYAQPQWQERRQTIGAESLGWAVAYILVLHNARLSGDEVAIPKSASAAKLANAAGFFPAPPFSTAYHLEEIINPGLEVPAESRLICRTADFFDAGNSVLQGQEWQAKAAADKQLQLRIAKLRDDVSLMRRDARCVKHDSTQT